MSHRKSEGKSLNQQNHKYCNMTGWELGNPCYESCCLGRKFSLNSDWDLLNSSEKQSMLFVLPCNVCVIMWFQELLENLFQRTTDWIYNYSILIKNECFPWYTIMSSHTCSQSQSQRRNCSFHLKIFPLSFSSIDFNRKRLNKSLAASLHHWFPIIHQSNGQLCHAQILSIWTIHNLCHLVRLC